MIPSIRDRLARMSIRTKLSLGIGVMLAALLLVSGTFYYGLNQERDAARQADIANRSATLVGNVRQTIDSVLDQAVYIQTNFPDASFVDMVSIFRESLDEVEGGG